MYVNAGKLAITFVNVFEDSFPVANSEANVIMSASNTFAPFNPIVRKGSKGYSSMSTTSGCIHRESLRRTSGNALARRQPNARRI